jgi:hypothetical protein
VARYDALYVNQVSRTTYDAHMDCPKLLARPVLPWWQMENVRNKFDSDRKWCAACEEYVPYLMSLDTSYCAQCGGEARLFSKEDWQAFSDHLKTRRPAVRRRPRRDSA